MFSMVADKACAFYWLLLTRRGMHVWFTVHEHYLSAGEWAAAHNKRMTTKCEGEGGCVRGMATTTRDAHPSRGPL